MYRSGYLAGGEGELPDPHLLDPGRGLYERPAVAPVLTAPQASASPLLDVLGQAVRQELRHGCDLPPVKLLAEVQRLNVIPEHVVSVITVQ